jgi:hypothetical protein
MIAIPLPNDVDLTGLDYMPIYGARLDASVEWLIAKRKPQVGFYSFNLWRRAWGSVPAGAIHLSGDAPEDDILCDAARAQFADWGAHKDAVMRKWVRHGEYLWHPVVAELAWGVWLGRLKQRHINAKNSWRNHARAAERHSEAPREAPDDDVWAWIAAEYPATGAYLAAHGVAGDGDSTGIEAQTCAARLAHADESAAPSLPKRSEAKIITPLPPCERAAQDGPLGKDESSGGGRAQRQGTGKPGKQWFVAEEGRLLQMFGAIAPMLRSAVDDGSGALRYRFVNVFKGALLERSDGGGVRIVLPSRQRAQSLIASHGEAIAAAGVRAGATITIVSKGGQR